MTVGDLILQFGHPAQRAFDTLTLWATPLVTLGWWLLAGVLVVAGLSVAVLVALESRWGQKLSSRLAPWVEDWRALHPSRVKERAIARIADAHRDLEEMVNRDSGPVEDAQWERVPVNSKPSKVSTPSCRCRAGARSSRTELAPSGAPGSGSGSRLIATASGSPTLTSRTSCVSRSNGASICWMTMMTSRTTTMRLETTRQADGPPSG